MIIDGKTKKLRNEQLAIETRSIQRRSKKIIKRLRKEYIQTGKTKGIELMACDYPREDMNKLLQGLANMNLISFTSRSDTYFIDIVVPDSSDKVTKANEIRSKPQKPNIEDFDPESLNPWKT